MNRFLPADLLRHVFASMTVLAATLLLAACASPQNVVVSNSVEPIYHHGVVAADHPVASQAGLEMLQLGGNAVDAAVATSFCLSVVRPYSCGLGGGGFMLIHLPDSYGYGRSSQDIAIDYRESAPTKVDANYYRELIDSESPSQPSQNGIHAVGIPGTVAGLLSVLEMYGRLDRATVMGPAIRAAEQGFSADGNFIEAVDDLRDRLKKYPEMSETASFIWEQLCRKGNLKVGDIVRNPDQARALQLITKKGRTAFYHGEISEAILKVLKKQQDPMAMLDLFTYRVRRVTPLRGQFRDVEFITMPSPSSGGIAMLQILGIIDRRADLLTGIKHNSPQYVHILAEAMKHAFADRAQWLADDLYVDVPTDRLLSSEYLNELASRIDLDQTHDRYTYGSVTPATETTIQDAGTSHLSVIDANGMAVACTETINLVWGSLVTVPGFGFVLNNEMDDFTTIPGQPNAFGLQQSDRNLPEPGKRPLSSMSPTIVLQDGKPVIIAGGSGGPRIITGTLQCILNCLLFDMKPREAVGAPRFHHQWMPEKLFFEKGWTNTDVIDAMRLIGHSTARRPSVGKVQLILIDEDGIRAASDPRKGGEPAGY